MVMRGGEGEREGERKGRGGEGGEGRGEEEGRLGEGGREGGRGGRESERERENLLGSIVNMMIHTCTNKNYNEGLSGLIQGDLR